MPLHLKFNRVQFTPDLMPADLLGTNVRAGNTRQSKKKFEFSAGTNLYQHPAGGTKNQPGQPPKTQSALLEAMQEHTVTNCRSHL